MPSIKQCVLSVSIPTLAIALTACGGSGIGNVGLSSDGSTPTPDAAISEKYQGVWLAPAYGKGIRIDESTYTAFDYSSSYCILDDSEQDLDDEDLETVLFLEGDNLILFLENGSREFHSPGVIFEPENNLPTACGDGFAEPPEEDQALFDPAGDMDFINEQIGELSVSLEATGTDWDSLYQTYGAGITANATEEAYANAIIELLSPLRDVHTRANTALGLFEFENKPTLFIQLAEEYKTANNIEVFETQAQIDAANAYIEENIAIVNALPLSYAEDDTDINSAANGQLQWFTNDGLAYLRINNMYGFATAPAGQQFPDAISDLAALEPAIDQLIAEVADTDALIIDVRTNGGGRDVASLALASRFVASETHVYSKQARLGSSRTPLEHVHISPRGSQQYLKPIILLTSHHTASAAEIFTLSMAAREETFIIGQSTQGAFSDILFKTAPSGMVLGLSNEYYLSPEGEWYEGLGIPVDLEVAAFDLDARQAEQDVALETAIGVLLDE